MRALPTLESFVSEMTAGAPLAPVSEMSALMREVRACNPTARRLSDAALVSLIRSVIGDRPVSCVDDVVMRGIAYELRYA